SAAESAAAFSGHDAAPGTSGGNGVRIRDVRSDVRAAAGRLGDAVGGALSHPAVRFLASAFHPAARCDALCGASEDAHHPRLFLLPDVHRPLRRDLVPHADREGWDLEADGAVELPPTGAARGWAARLPRQGRCWRSRRGPSPGSAADTACVTLTTSSTVQGDENDSVHNHEGRAPRRAADATARPRD